VTSDSRTYKPIGIFGGTFDPVHFGHLRTAQELLQDLDLAEVRLMPCGAPPHRGATLASSGQRLQMLRLALAGCEGMVVDERELSRPGPSYMIDSLTSLRREVGDDRPLVLILGMDAFAGLDGWYRWRELTSLAHLLVMHRPGWRLPDSGAVGALLRDAVANGAEALHGRAAGAVLPWPVTQLDISATRIRALLREHRSPRFLLPDAVLDYILAQGLYQENRQDGS
jgi:nicotinate-nucleotide adenylyltransferase